MRSTRSSDTASASRRGRLGHGFSTGLLVFSIPIATTAESSVLGGLTPYVLDITFRGMLITHVECIRVPFPGADPPFLWRRGLLGSPADGEAAVLRLGTDEGVSGVAI